MVDRRKTGNHGGKEVRQTLVSSREEVHTLLEKAKDNRKIGTTQANDVSSRSHFVF